MRRILFLLSLCLLFAAATSFGQRNNNVKGNDGNNWSRNDKFDDDLNDRYAKSKDDKNKGKERIRVIIQHRTQPNAQDRADVQKAGAKFKRDINSLRAIVAELS